MRKAIVSIGAGPQRRLLALSRRTFAPYARHHGWALELRTEMPPGLGRPAPWAKIAVLRELSSRYDLLCWLDADLMIVDPRADIADALAPDADLGLVEHSFAGKRMPNSGVLLLRGGRPGREFCDAVWALQQYTDHRWWENAAICELLGYDLDPPRPVRDTPLRARTTFLDPRWNSIPDAPAAQPYVRHYPGYSVKTRWALMARDLVVRRR